MALAAPPEVNEAIRQRIALRRLGTPEDVANVIAFLASEPGGYVTGDCVNIDGGYIS
jgi:3-oxoacyl-[acyl-carrier protein] reductase